MQKAEYTRLADEMAEDAKWQLQLFTFAVTGSAAVLTLLSTQRSAEPGAITSALVPMGLFFLAPLVVVVPSSLMILNRARTRNRKAAFIVAYLDSRRLAEEPERPEDKVDSVTTLAKVRESTTLPWETALQLLDRSNLTRNRRIHLGPALRYMFWGFFTIEALCLALTAVSLQPQSWISAWVLVVAVALFSALVGYRLALLRRLKREDSIQGFVRRWLELRTDRVRWPTYLREWIEECETTRQLAPRPDGINRSRL